MAFIILASTLALELVLLVYCWLTKQRQEKAKHIVHLSESVIFALLLLSPRLEWSLRWVGLAVLFCLWAFTGVGALLSPKATAEYQRRSAAAGTLKTALAIFLALTPALVFPPYQLPATTGPYSVTSVAESWVDNGRIEPYTHANEPRTVNVIFWYPENSPAGMRHPLVLFSHGGLGLATSNTSLYRELASHGYVVCAIGHPYHAFWARGENGRLTFVNPTYFQELQEEDPQRDIQQSLAYYQKWLAVRTGDINFVLDTVLNRAAAGHDGVYALIDSEKIGLIGHSLGGSAVLAVPRQRNDIDAVIALEAPFLYDIVGTNQAEFIFTSQAYPVPVLNIYSDSAWGHLAEWPQYARNAELLSNPTETSFNVHLPGAGHFSLTDLSLTSPFLVRLLEGGKANTDSLAYLAALNRVCLEFCERFLANQPYQ